MPTLDSIAETLAELDSLLRLFNLASRTVSRRDENDPYFQILLRLYYTEGNRLPQVQISDNLQLSVSQVQKVTATLQDEGYLSREEGAPRGGMFIDLTSDGRRHVERYLGEREHEFAVIEQLLGEQTAKVAASPTLRKLRDDLKAIVIRRGMPLKAAG